ncbi:hypothetical protein ANCDUO_07472 [Ancylostoma duodenale]|uniref:Uncharacterized protein n=1 Tax=Ancylostoma duodenale TaxID=51022 RepID=A0A0C2GTC0_9BILA|nr:hypothetical protein ANCDUO_07472 [Ancylostoma duodenale]
MESTPYTYVCYSTPENEARLLEELSPGAFKSAFAVVVFGSLLFGVYKEKRLYVVPYLVFQIISVGVTVIVLLSFIIAIAVKSNMVIDLAKDLGGVSIHVPQKELDAALASFTVLFILALCLGGLLQAYFFEVIYAFYGFLHDRECSFNFNFEATPTIPTPETVFGSTNGVPPPYQEPQQQQQ